MIFPTLEKVGSAACGHTYHYHITWTGSTEETIARTGAKMMVIIFDVARGPAFCRLVMRSCGCLAV